jgi:hypothetical protein
MKRTALLLVGVLLTLAGIVALRDG